jgi:putative membrane protein
MATRSDLAAPDETGVDRRLHPLSWLFVLLQQLRAYAIPLVVLMVTGRGNRLDFVGLIAIAVLVLISLARYFTYRFRLDRHAVVIRTGLFQTTMREIPYERIHNVSTHQSLLQRLMGVAELRLESAGGSSPEAQMRVLSLSDAQALETFIRQRGRAGVTVAGADEAQRQIAASEPVRPLLTMDTAEVVRLGLISNRGLVVVAAIVGALTQIIPDQFDVGPQLLRSAFGWVAQHGPELVPARLMGPIGWALSAFALLIALLIVVRVLSVVLALLQFHGFTLVDVGRQLRIERGLLTRIRTHLPRRRIQAWRLTETWLHRRFGRQSLRVDNAVSAGPDDQPAARDLAPLADPDAMRSLIGDVLMREDWPPASWQRLHPRAWRRLIVVPTTVVLVTAAGLVWRYGAAGGVALVFVPLLVARAVLWARHAGYAESGSLVAVRTGWLNRTWAFAEMRKLQSLRLTSSPFDRRHGMATLWLDTAGASSRDGVLCIRFMPEAAARDLYERLAGQMTQTNTKGTKGTTGTR